jgi:hypothetical protein
MDADSDGGQEGFGALQQAEAQRQAQLAQEAEAARQAQLAQEAAQQAEIQRQAVLAQQAEAQRQAQIANEAARRQAIEDAFYEQQARAQAEQQAEAQRQAELAQQAEVQRQYEEAQMTSALQRAEFARRAEAERQALVAQQAEAQRQVELAQQAEQERIGALQRAEAQRQAQLAIQAEEKRRIDAENAYFEQQARAQAEQQAEQQRLGALQQAEAERQAQLAKEQQARQVEAQRVEQERLGALQQAEIARQAETQRQAELAQQAEAARQAEQARVGALQQAQNINSTETASATDSGTSGALEQTNTGATRSLTATPATTKPETKAPSQEAIDTIKSQILGQNLTSKWQGEGHGSAEKNAADMARILASIGITDIKQFGEVPKLEQAIIREGYNGQVAHQDENGYFVVSPPDADGNTSRINLDPSQIGKAYGYEDAEGNFKTVDPSKVVTKNGMVLVETGKTYGNKLTGQEVPLTYSERQTGNAWGGTFAGKDNTGYRVQFGADGTPYFYTTKSSSNDLANLMQDLGPLGQIGLAVATGGLSIPQQIAANLAIQVLSGKNIGDAIKGAALSYAGSQIPGLDAIKETTGFLNGIDPTGVLSSAFQNAAVSGGSALLSGGNVGDAMMKGAVTGGTSGAVNALMGNIDGFKDLSPSQKSMAINAVTGVISGKPLDQIIINTAIAAANAEVAKAKGATTDQVVSPYFTPTGGLTTTEDAGTSPSGLQVAGDTTGVASNLGGVNSTTQATLDAMKDVDKIAAGAKTTGAYPTTPAAVDTEFGNLKGAQDAATARTKADIVAVGNAEADNPQEAQYLALSRNPNATQFTYGGQTYTVGGLDNRVTSELDRVRTQELNSNIANAPSRSEAFKIAREALGAGQTFTWNGQSYSTSTAEERPDLTGKQTTPQFTSTVSNYVSDKLAQNLNDPNFNPADLTKAEMAQFVSAYSSATPAQQQAMLKGVDQATFKVIDAMLNETTKYNPTGKVTNVAPDTATSTLKAYDKPFLATALDVGKGAANQVAGDVAGLGVRGAQFLGDLMGQDTNSLAGVQKLLADDKDKSMSKLIGNEKVVAGGIASGIESAMSWALGGPLASVAMNAATVANNTWVEGANKWIAPNGDVFSSPEEARSQGVDINKVRKLTPEENGMRTAAMTSLETVGEMLGIPGMKMLMKGLPITGSSGQIINYIKNATLAWGNEQLSELATTVAQFSVDKFAKFGLNQNASFDDFKQALQDTVLATTAAVGSASGIATAYNSAAGKNTGAISEADRTSVSPDMNTFLLARGADFGAKAGDTSNQGLNPISSEAVDFMAQNPDSQRTILDGIKNQFASASLAASLAFSSAAGATDTASLSSPTSVTAVADYSSNPASISVSNSLKAGADASTAISTAINNVAKTNGNVSSAIAPTVSAAINSGVQVSTVINSVIDSSVKAGVSTSNAVQAAVTASIAAGTDTSTAITTSVKAAVTAGADANTAATTATTAAVTASITAGTDTTTAITTSVTAAVDAGANITSATNAAVTAAVTTAVNTGADTTTAINSSVTAAVTSGADISTAVTTAVTAAVDASVTQAVTNGTDVSTAITSSVSSSVSSAVTNNTSVTTAVDTAVSTAITSAVTNNADVTAAVNSSVSSAITSAVQNNVDSSTAITTAVNSAVTTAIKNNVDSSTAITTAVESAINASAKTETNVNTVVNTAVTSAVNAAVNAGVNVNTAVNAAINAAINANINTKSNIDIPALIKTAVDSAKTTSEIVVLRNSVNELIAKASTPTPAPEPAPKPAIKIPSQSAGLNAGLLAGMMSGPEMGRLPPQMLKAYMTQDKFVDPLAKLQALQEGMNTEKMPALPQVNTEKDDMPDQGTWKYGNAPDDLDTLFGEQAQKGEEANFAAGGYVAPLQMAFGGAMPLPLLVKSGGALGALPRGDGRLDFRHGAHVAGEGDGQSDDIKAMLADGEFVFPADVVSALGNGSTKAGSDKLYEMMHSIRERARSKKPKDLPPPALKSPLDYLKKVRR